MDLIIVYLPSVLAIVLAITFHEAAHGFVALLFGDSTARSLGRVTFNPIKHVDPFGTLILPGLLTAMHAPFVFGYAKPVPINFNRLKPLSIGAICVAAAGPGANLILAIISGIIMRSTVDLPYFLNNFLIASIKLNVILAAFNLIPLLPLDGGRILTFLLPSGTIRQAYERTEPFGMIILLILFMMPSLSHFFLSHPIDPLGFILRPIVEVLKNGVLTISGHA